MILGPYTLHPGVIWVNEGSTPAATQQISYTILNRVSVHSTPNQNIEIELEAKDSGNKGRGYFSREQFDYLKESEQNATIINIIYRSVSHSVIVKAGGVQLTPKRETESVDDTDMYIGTVTLQEV